MQKKLLIISRKLKIVFTFPDKNECDTTGMCEHGECINSDGGFECSCDFGYELTVSTCIASHIFN